MVATRCPTFIRATATCIAVVDFPEPPFSLPSTTTWADRRVAACIDMTPDPRPVAATSAPTRGSECDHRPIQSTRCDAQETRFGGGPFLAGPGPQSRRARQRA